MRDFNPQMANLRLHNYLRSCRRKSGLTQQEVAFLLGAKTGDLVSRYEKRRWLPPLETALACEAIFGVPVSELFAGVHEAKEKEIRERMRELRSKLVVKTVKGSSETVLKAHKLKWLDARGTPHATETARS
jgi:transcriptional regulator with XRE-family HTH domain